MFSIVPHLVAVTDLATSYRRHVGPLAATTATSKAIGGLALVALAFFGLLLAAAASAVRGLAVAVAELLRLAATAMAATAMTFAVVLTLLILLIHH